MGVSSQRIGPEQNGLNSLRRDLIGLAPQDNEKAGPFQIRLPPPVAFGDKLYETNFLP
jgi:hypothetical protein